MAPFTLRWGIVTTGSISTSFTQDLLIDPATRHAEDVKHVVQAVASRSVASASTFIEKIKAAEAPYDWGVKQGRLDHSKAYGSYAELFADPDVDVVYVGTPHTQHFVTTKNALKAGKHVLCEKPFVLDVKELDELIALAKEKKGFLMEAVWTRFHPLGYEVQRIIHGGQLGKVKRFEAQFTCKMDLDSLADSSRMVDPALGGGGLLDGGPYPCTWAMLALHQHPDRTADPVVKASYQRLYPRSGVDLMSHWVVEWEGLAPAILTTDIDSSARRDHCVIIQCEEADLVIEYPPWKPETFRIVPHPDDRNAGSVKEETVHHHPVSHGYGMQYEADEVGRCIRDGKLQSERMPWAESRIVQGILDEVRKSGSSATKGLISPTV